MKKNNKGFSLVELIVVIAIMAVLVVVLAPAYLRYVDKARLQKDVSAIGEVVQSIKIAAAEEDCIDAIPTQEVSDEYKITTKVLIAKETGVVSAKSLMDNSDYFVSEVCATIGANVVLKSDDFVNYGVELKVTRDDDYKIYLAIEDYNYSETTKEALKQLGLETYQSTVNVAAGIQNNWTQKAQSAYDKAYWAAWDAATNDPSVLTTREYVGIFPFGKYESVTITQEEYATKKGKEAANTSINQDIWKVNKDGIIPLPELEDDAKTVFIDATIEEVGSGADIGDSIQIATQWQNNTVNNMKPTPREGQ